jgi:MFS-type transporter involved in bile tolerance (Atg22 family)
MQQSRSARPTERSARGLDWFVFFVADVQTGFGPFVAVYLTEHKWTQTDIGLLLSISGIVALAGQMPGGALVDAVRSEHKLAGISVAVIALCTVAGLRRRAGSSPDAGARELRAGTGDSGDQSRPGRTRQH